MPAQTKRPPLRLAVIHVGPHVNSKGGITSAILNLLKIQSADPDLAVAAIATTARREYGVLGDAWLCASALVRVFLACLMRPRPVLHLHLASRGSAFRKGIVVQIARLFGVGCLIHDHGIQPYYGKSGRFVRWWIRGLLRRARMIVVLAETDKAFIESLAGVPVVFVPNAIEIPPAAQMANPGSGDVVRFLFLGGDMRRKGMFVLLPAFESLRKEGLAIALTVAGNDDSGEVQRWIREHQLDDSVTMTGWIRGKDKAAVIRNADVFVLPSFREGLPVAMLEAMSYGLPVIASTVGGIPEAVVEGETGLLVAPGDAAGLAAAMKRLVLDRDLRKRMSAAGRKRAEDCYSLPVIFGRVKELYRQIQK